MPAAVDLVWALMAASPHLTIIGGGTSAFAQRSELLEAGATQICASRGEVRHVVRLYALRRSASRLSQTSADPPFGDARRANS
jgi:hypothetical protein